MARPEKKFFRRPRNHFDQRGVAVAVWNRRWTLILVALVLCVRFPGCADDNELGGFANGTAYLDGGLILSWAAPTAYSDATTLDPMWELDVYEIYINRTGLFFPDDEPSAYISAIDSDGNSTSEFDLGMLDYPFVVGQTYHVSMRAVTVSGTRSDFSPVFSFNLLSGPDTAPSVDQFLCTPSTILKVRLPKA